jgi:hypothetical protein
MSLKATVHFKIPGKTFLCGEYLALFGGPSLVLTTNPLFEVICQAGSGRHHFHQDSPAGKYIAQYAEFFSKWDMEFRDPYLTGGFGASTAQFIGVCLLHLQSENFEKEKFFSTKRQIALDVWSRYRKLFSSDITPPSGADLVAQIVGGLSVFDAQGPSVEVVKWPFADKDILLFKTEIKIATHEHLAKSDLNPLNLQRDLRPIAQASISGLVAEDWEAWISAQVAFSKILTELHLVHSDTQLLLQKIAKIPGVLHARGCGALGADVIAICIDKNVKDSVVHELKELKFMASLQNDQAYGTFIDVANLSEVH